MPSKKPSRKEMFSLTGDIRPEDGIDPRELARKARPRKDQRKARQLCAQVAETLSLVLSGECSDELLQNLQVVAVDALPDASQLVVTVRAIHMGESPDPALVLMRLEAARNKLRCEVGAAITRKLVPNLVFRVL